MTGCHSKAVNAIAGMGRTWKSDEKAEKEKGTIGAFG